MKKKESKSIKNSFADKSSKETGEVGTTNKISSSLKIVIVALVIAILTLLGYIMYQAGKKSASISNNVNTNHDAIKTNETRNNSQEALSEGQDMNNNTNTNSSDDNREAVTDIISKNSISAEDLNELDDEINGVSTHYDDLENASTDLQKWPN